MSGCPFLNQSKKSNKDPFVNAIKPSSADPKFNLIQQEFPMPYVSPYYNSFNKFTQTSPNPLAGVEFFYQNSIFHQGFVTKYRKSDQLIRISVANELRESGNRNYNKGLYEKAALCYEHGFCLFFYAELVENTLVLINPQIDSGDLQAVNGIIFQLLINYTLTLIKLKNFSQAEVIIKQAERFQNSLKTKIFQALCKICNSETCFKEIASFAQLFEMTTNKKEYAEVYEFYKSVLYKLQKETCCLYKELFSEFSVDVNVSPSKNYDLETIVVEKLNEKYEKMIEYYKDSEVLSQIVLERIEIQTVFTKIKNIKMMTPTDNNEIMMAFVKSLGIDLSLPKNQRKFEAAKRGLISKTFNKGKFNKGIVYNCIQEAMNEYESAKPDSDAKLDEELSFWNKSLVIILVFSFVVVFFSRPEIMTQFLA